MVLSHSTALQRITAPCSARGGYGSEQFSLKTAKPGTYTVRARFYGHRQQVVAPATTLMLRLSTGFGTPEQKNQDVVLRLAAGGYGDGGGELHHRAAAVRAGANGPGALRESNPFRQTL